MLHNNLYKFLLIPEIVLVFYALLMFIGIYVKGISIFTFTILLSILAFILYLKSKGKLYGYISYIICFVLLIFSYLGLCQNNRVIIESILGISFLLIPILSLFIYLHEKKHKNRKVYKWLSVVIYGLSVLKLASLDIFSFGNSLSCLIGFVILLLTMLINLDDNIIVYFISVLSIITFANYLDFTSLSQNIICIFISSYALLMSLLFASRFKNRAYNILTIIFFSFIMFIILLNINNVIAIYLALVSIICFIIDILSKKINGLYIVGIVFLAITILYEINTYFKDLPFWIYLLLGGLAIIIFASIKLSKKIKND